MNRAEVKTRWLAEVKALMHRYAGCAIAVQGARGVNPQQLVAEIREGARGIVKSLTAEDVIPRGVCKPKDVRVTLDGKSIRVEPPPALAQWWESVEN